MTSTNHGSDHRVFMQTLPCGLDRLPQQPWTGKIMPIPRESGSPIGDYGRASGFGHRVFLEGGQVRSKQRKSVGGVSEQISLEQYVGDIAGAVGRESG